MRNGKIPSRNGPLCSGWWRNRPKSEKKIIVVAIIFAVLLILALFIYLLLRNEPEVCQSSTCKRTSQELLNYIDIKVDPCEDFYRFSCGNFLQKQNTSSKDRGSRSTRNIIEDEIQTQIKNLLEEAVVDDDPLAFNLAKKFYRLCINESAIEAEGLEGMKQIFERMGGWPTLIGNNWREDKFDWKDAVYKLREMGIYFEFFLTLGVQRDQADPNRYILSLGDPSYRSSKVSEEIQRQFLRYMVELATLMGADKTRAQHEQRQVMHFILQLGTISEEASQTNKTHLYNPYSISELEQKFPNANWMEYINRILAPAHRVNGDDTINLTHPLYVEKLLQLLKNTKKRVISNFLCWEALQYLLNYLPRNVLDAAYRYLEQVTGRKEERSRRNTCANEIDKRFSTAISAIYVKKYLDAETRHQALFMIRRFKYQFMEDIFKLNWLDKETKDKTLEKLVSSVEDIPSYDNLIEESKFYEEVEIFEDKLLTSLLNLDYAATNIRYEKLSQPVNENFFKNQSTVTGLDIVYSPKENSLKIPVGLFHRILYQKNRPEYMNHGALGTLIAHEISHIITEAKYKNAEGKLSSFWSSYSLLNYERQLQCLSTHYGKFLVSMMEQHFNSSNTREEDMADLAGMKVAYDTYIIWVQENGVEPQLPGLKYSPNQLFWISSAIYHCTKYSHRTLQRHIANYQPSPEQFRVNGALQNLDEFAEDFGCPAETNMNPRNKCRIW